MSKQVYKTAIMAMIAEYGVEEVKKHFHDPWIEKMVIGYKLSKKTGVALLAIGYDGMNVDAAEAHTECIIESTENTEDRTKIQAIYDYWKTNKGDILRAHGV